MNVLHLDRSHFFQKIVKQAGEMNSVNYMNSESIKKAWSILEKSNVDLILTAQELDDGSADDLIKKLEKSSFSEIPVIVITSNDNLGIREHFFNLGVVDFILKAEFTPEKLQEHLEYFQRQDKMIQYLQDVPIAILDDSKLSQNVICSILNIHKIEQIDTFSDPRELLKTQKSYDIYFVDLMLPGISGERVVIELRKKYPHAVIIVISSLDSYNTIVHVLESGADDYIIKPFDARLLMARLKSNFRHFRIIGELKEQRNQMKLMSITDSLTGAYNHRYLVERLQAEILRCQEKGRHMSVLLLDLDKFKLINDTYGHPAGDRVLKELTLLFKEAIGDKDVFGRYGGEEFLLMLPGVYKDPALEMVDDLRSQFYNMEIEGIHHPVSFSGGLVEWKDESPEELLQKVDELMYQAKDGGRNQIVC